MWQKRLGAVLILMMSYAVWTTFCVYWLSLKIGGAWIVIWVVGLINTILFVRWWVIRPKMMDRRHASVIAILFALQHVVAVLVFITGLIR